MREIEEKNHKLRPGSFCREQLLGSSWDHFVSLSPHIFKIVVQHTEVKIHFLSKNSSHFPAQKSFWKSLNFSIFWYKKSNISLILIYGQKSYFAPVCTMMVITSHSRLIPNDEQNWLSQNDLKFWRKKLTTLKSGNAKKNFSKFESGVRTLKRVFHKVGREKNMAWYREGPLHVFNDELHLKPTEAFRYLLHLLRVYLRDSRKGIVKILRRTSLC